MQVVDLTPAYLSTVANQRQFQEYERLFPELFEHYFQYWCPRSYPYAEMDETEISQRVKRIQFALTNIGSCLQDARLGTSNLQIVLFVGGSTSNGHAFLRDGEPVVWLPVETYATDSRALIFIAHELIHGLHYAATPDFVFDDAESKHHIGRQLITEGVATYLTMEILNVSDREALWADYLSDADVTRWMEECRGQYPILAGWFLDHFHESMPKAEIFQANDPTDVWRYRAGYYVGIHVVRAIAEQRSCSASELLEIPRGKFEADVIEQLGRTSDDTANDSGGTRSIPPLQG